MSCAIRPASASPWGTQMIIQAGLTRHDVADFIEAHDGMPQVSHVTLGRRCFFPAPTRQIVINDITALAVLPREEILESAAPEVHEGGATDQRLELVGLDVMHVTCPEVHVEHGEEGFPPVVMTEPFHQTGKGLGGRHIAPWVVSWLPIRTAARRSFPEREIGSTPEMDLSTPLSGHTRCAPPYFIRQWSPHGAPGVVRSPLVAAWRAGASGSTLTFLSPV